MVSGLQAFLKQNKKGAETKDVLLPSFEEPVKIRVLSAREADLINDRCFVNKPVVTDVKSVSLTVLNITVKSVLRLSWFLTLTIKNCKILMEQWELLSYSVPCSIGAKAP